MIIYINLGVAQSGQSPRFGAELFEGSNPSTQTKYGQGPRVNEDILLHDTDPEDSCPPSVVEAEVLEAIGCGPIPSG